MFLAAIAATSAAPAARTLRPLRTLRVLRVNPFPCHTANHFNGIRLGKGLPIMDLSVKVPYLKNICGIAIDLSSLPIPSSSVAGQPFYDSYLASSAAQSVYFGKSSVSFSEVSKEHKAGDYFEQKVQLSFPNSDAERALRIEEFRKAKFLVVQLSGGNALLLGRNDYFQNALPTIKISSNAQLTTVEFTSTSMMPVGLLPEYNSGLLPHSVPVNLLNAN